MSATLPADPAPPGILPPDARAEPASAIQVLEGRSLAAQLATAIGAPIEALRSRLPGPAQSMLDGAVRRALTAAANAALRSDPARTPLPMTAAWFHRGAAAAAGAAGGALGLPGTLLELPVTTTLLLRQIAATAAEQGENLANPAAAAECLKVFALGGRGTADDAAESAYFATRLALAQAVRGVATRGLGALLPGFVGAIAGRFAPTVALKLSAQAAPVIGAAAGAAVNLAFLEHFRATAEAHFTVRRLERAHGAAAVRTAYEAMRDVRFDAAASGR